MNGGQFNKNEWTNSPLGGVVATQAAPINFQTDISGFKPDIHSWSNLAAIASILVATNSIVQWYDISASLMRTTVFLVSSDATNTDIGVQRPNDWATSGRVWFQIGGAG